MDPTTLLIGTGKVYVAAVGTAFPALTATPGASWTDLGVMQDGLELTPEREIKEIEVDSESGPVEAVITKEQLVLKTKLAEGTLENLAKVLGQTVTDTAPGAGTIGTREIPMYKGVGRVSRYAFLFRGETLSPYGTTYPAQYELPVGYFAGATGMAFKKGDNAQIPVEFHALVDPNAATATAKFGRLIAQDAAAF
ncbi:MAG: hypothetical protein HZB51_34165 [Chloroflexi bacterium]|nr:hypothetical protein [Chloroflexota bacterium]